MILSIESESIQNLLWDLKIKGLYKVNYDEGADIIDIDFKENNTLVICEGMYIHEVKNVQITDRNISFWNEMGECIFEICWNVYEKIKDVK